MRLGIYGGSFDPFHRGHRELIQAALEQNLVDEILLLPLGLAPHKKRYQSLPAWRWEMLKRGVAGLEHVRLSRYEIDRPGLFSYTADSLPALRQELLAQGEGEPELYLLYGSDMLFSFANWYKPREIAEQARILVAQRGHEDWALMENQAAKLRRDFAADIRLFDMPAVELSSTELREDLADGTWQGDFFSEELGRFLQRYQPYRFYRDLLELSARDRVRLALYEQRIRPLISTKRLLHSLGVMSYAVHLACRHGQDPMQAALAGLLHDCCKDLPLADQFQLAGQYSQRQQKNRALAHGPAAASWIRRLGLKDPQLARAIAYHSTLHAGADELEKILFLADKIEFSRNYADLAAIRDLAENQLDAACQLCLLEVQKALTRRGQKMAQDSLAALNALK